MVTIPVLFAITAAALAGDVSFLSCDQLEGRLTPSRGLDIAAEFIASRFRASGLEVRFQGNGSRNVIGILRGSHPQLRDTYVIVSAHYDHVGVARNCSEEDCIRNGANDNASGVAAMIQIAAELAASRPVPLRSLVFIAFFGEEAGLHGSSYYVRNPAVPLASTIAAINFEQLGRTDDKRGPQLRRAALTGFGYSTVGSRMKASAALHGVEIYDPPDTLEYFARSDNMPLARAGVPAHTVAVTLDFADYHGPDDEWEKIDYANMTRVTRALATGVRGIANSRVAPKWLEKPFIRSEEPPEAAPPGHDSSPASPSPSQSTPSERRKPGSAPGRTGIDP